MVHLSHGEAKGGKKTSVALFVPEVEYVSPFTATQEAITVETTPLSKLSINPTKLTVV